MWLPRPILPALVAKNSKLNLYPERVSTFVTIVRYVLRQTEDYLVESESGEGKAEQHQSFTVGALASLACGYSPLGTDPREALGSRQGSLTRGSNYELSDNARPHRTW